MSLFKIIFYSIVVFSVLLFIKKKVLWKMYGEYVLKKGFQIYPPREDIDISYIDKNTQEEKDYLLRDFFIASVFRPYQLLGNNNGIYSYNSIKMSIQKGARFHFIDIWCSNNSCSTPIVRNNIKNTDSLHFDKVCEVYSIESWKNNIHEPLILYLNIQGTAQTNIELQDKLAKSIVHFFKNRKLPIKYSYIKQNIAEMPIGDAINKLIIVLNIQPVSISLKEVTNAVIDNNKKDTGRITNITYKQSHVENGVKSIKIDSDEFKIFNKKKLGLLTPLPANSFFTWIFPKRDLHQIPAINPMLVFGFNIVPIHYQMPGKIRDTYLSFFKKRGFVLKPENMRYKDNNKFLFKKINPEVTFKSKCKNYILSSNKICF